VTFETTGGLDPRALIEQTDWPRLEHAMGPAEDVPAALTSLAEGDQGQQARSLRFLNEVLHHGGAVYSATTPAALYVAAILPDDRIATSATFVIDRGEPAVVLRAALLEWLGSVAQHPATHESHPALFDAVSPFIEDQDAAVRIAALAAAVPLLDTPELAHHRPTLVPKIRGALTTSGRRTHQTTAAHLEPAATDSRRFSGQLVTNPKPPTEANP
jgi:hypothetical protein